jgi:hypothetical protein
MSKMLLIKFDPLAPAMTPGQVNGLFLGISCSLRSPLHEITHFVETGSRQEIAM